MARLDPEFKKMLDGLSLKKLRANAVKFNREVRRILIEKCAGS